MTSAAIDMRDSDSLGARLKHARGPVSQRAFAEALGVAVGTYQNYERDDRLPDSALLTRLIDMGWSANWLLGGVGPEHLTGNASSPLPYAATANSMMDSLAESQAARSSQPVKHDLAKIALQLVSEVLDDNGLELPSAKRAEVTLLVFELLQDGIPEAKVLRLVRAATA